MIHTLKKHPYTFVILCWALMVLPSLGITPLFDYDETIYAQTALDMLHQHQWVIPTANGMQFFEKPPFTYYMMDLAFVIFGENAFAARLPSAVFTLFTMLLLYRFGSKMHSRSFGLAAAGIYLSMFEVGFLAHAAILDPVLNFFIAGALLYYLQWQQSTLHKDAVWVAAMCGAAVAIKGPVGAVIPGMVIIIDAALNRKLPNLLRNIPWLTCLPIFLITAMPWYLLIMIANGPAFLYEFIWVHNIERALHPMQGHGGGWHYYLIVFAVSVLPWLAWIPTAIQRGWHASGDDSLSRISRISLIWALLVIVLFSFAQTKLPHYISSIYPGVALLLAALLLQQKQAQRGKLVFTSILLVPVALLLIFFPALYEYAGHFIHHPRAIAIIQQDIRPSAWIAISGLALLISLLWIWHQHSQTTQRVWRLILLGFALQLSVLIALGSFAGKLIQAPQMQIAATLRMLPEQVPVYSYQLNAPSISFYSGRNFTLVSELPDAQLDNSTQTYALFLRSENKQRLPMLETAQPVIDQGGFLLYLLHPSASLLP